MQNKLKLIGIFLLSLLIATAPIYANTPQMKQKTPVSREEINQILQISLLWPIATATTTSLLWSILQIIR